MIKLKNITFWFFILISLFLNATKIFAQKKWSLELCIDYALVHNLNLKGKKYNTESKKENSKQSYRGFLPTIGGITNYRVVKGRSIDDDNNVTFNDNFSNYYSISASLDLFKGFKKINAVKVSNFIYKAFKEEVLQEKYMLSFRIMNAYYDVVFAQGLLSVSEEQVLLSTKNYELIIKQIELGLKAKVDVYEMESVLIEDKLELTKSKGRLLASKLKLQQEMNIEVSTDFEIINKEQEAFLPPKMTLVHVDSVYSKALCFLPIVKAQEYYVKASEKEIKVTQGNLYPSLSFSTGYSTSFFETNRDSNDNIISFKNQIENNLSQFISFNLKIPIFNQWSYRSGIKQQKIALKNTINQQNILKQELYKTIQELIQNYKNTKLAVVLSQKNEEKMLLAFQVAQKKYDRGLISVLELNQFKNRYAKVKTDYLQVKLELEIYKKTLSFYNGIETFKNI